MPAWSPSEVELLVNRMRARLRAKGTVAFGKQTGLLIFAALELYVERARQAKDPSNFVVEEVGKNGSNCERLLVCDNLMVALAAFPAAVALRPGRHVVLRQGARVIKDTNRPEPETQKEPRLARGSEPGL